MKLNKKVFAGALALAMGLGVAAPAVNSFAAPADSTMEIVEKEYRAAGEDWLKAYNELEDARAIEKDFDDKIEAAKKAVQEATNKEIDANKLDTKEEDKALEEAKANLTKAQNDFNEEDSKPDKDEYRIKKLQKDLDEANKKLEEATKAKEAKEKENAKAVEEAEKATLEAKNALDEIKNAKAEKMITVDGEEKNIADALEALKAKETEKRTAFKDQGANEDIINVMKKLGDVVLPDDEAVEEEVEESMIKKIEEQLKVNKEKLAAAKGVKMYMPESYKLYKDRIDTAIANAEKAIKTAEDFLAANKKVSSLFTVAYAAEEEEKTAEEVLKDLQDSEKELDSVLGDIEADSKEQNDKDEADEKEDEETEGTEEDEETEGTKEDDKPVVEEKEDVKPANNVKTGVAGVAGVGAVLAAASAAYVSSKRK